MAGSFSWEADDSQRRRYYVGKCDFEKRNPNTGRLTSLRLFSGRLRMPDPPMRFLVGSNAQSPIRWESFSGLSPAESEPSEDSEPSEESESVGSRAVPEHVPESEEEDVVMTEADMERNATRFLDNICDEA